MKMSKPKDKGLRGKWIEIKKAIRKKSWQANKEKWQEEKTNKSREQKPEMQTVK